MSEPTSRDRERRPFFARYLEGQPYPRVKSDVRAGARGLQPFRPPVAVTQKWPSDGDDGPPLTTLKYPSDQDG